MAKKTKITDGQNSEPVANCDQSLEPVANCDHLDEVDANCDHPEKGEVVLSQHDIEKLIFTVRGEQVLIDRDLAYVYQVEVKQMNRQVKRNIERFPEDFMFQLTKDEYNSLKCQNGTSNSTRWRRLPPNNCPSRFSGRDVWKRTTTVSSSSMTGYISWEPASRTWARDSAPSPGCRPRPRLSLTCSNKRVTARQVNNDSDKARNRCIK